MIDRASMTDEEWYHTARVEIEKAIGEQNQTIATLRRELQNKNDAIEAVRLSRKSKRSSYVPQPTGKIGAGTSQEYFHAIIDKAFESRQLFDKSYTLDVSSKAVIEDTMFTRNANEFHAWALSVAEIITLCVSWLDTKGVGEVARASLFKEINERTD